MADHPPTAEYRVLPEIVKGNRGILAVAVLLALVSNVATLVTPVVAGRLITTLQEGGSLLGWGVALVGAGLGATIASAASGYLTARVGQGLVYRLRVRTMGHAFHSRIRDVRSLGAGNLSTRLTQDAANIKGIVDVGPVQLPMALLLMVATVVIMGVLDWVLLVITLASFVFAIAAVGVVIVALRRKFIAIQEATGTLTERFVDALDGLQVLKALRAERQVLGELSEDAEEVRRVEISAAALQSALFPILNLGQQVALVSVLIGGGVRLVGGDLSLAAFVAFLMYLLQLTTPLMTAITGFSTLQAGLAARERFNEVLALDPEDRSPAEAPRSAPPSASEEPAVAFSSVDFAYDEEPVLEEVDLVVPSRGLTSIVGMSGAGKSTVLGLIEGFSDPAAGKVRVLGRDRDVWSLAGLREHIGYVDQGFTLLRGSVRTNLTLGMETPPDDEFLYRTLERVALDEVVRALPQGLDTWIGGGTDLSGGQRQRLALARSLLTDARLVLLDEPTSQLDSLSEARLRDVVDELAQDRAVLVVAHRISTVQQADHVIVMDRGRVIAQGTHAGLLRDCPHYEVLVRGQMLVSPEPSLS
jgi:ABC-type multidrug transport system fused ATPase/permease subunit